VHVDEHIRAASRMGDSNERACGPKKSGMTELHALPIRD
jgi:hypothetical protein